MVVEQRLTLESIARLIATRDRILQGRVFDVNSTDIVRAFREQGASQDSVPVPIQVAT
jgi:hypothetical protein